MIVRNMCECVTIVVRSVGERTEKACRQLILDQGISESDIFTICEAPFSRAMRKSFETGLGSGKKWTLCVDADLLLRPGSIQHLIQFADQQPENVCEVQGYILDKFFGGARIGGVHLYRTSLLELALARIPAEGVNIRPEYHTLKRMEADGFPHVIRRYIVGLHDFEQYHRDVFRKCLVQAHKHFTHTEMFVSIWRELALQDEDFRVALAGFARGVEHYGDVRIDVRMELFRGYLESLNLAEKTPLPPLAWSLQRVEETIVKWTEPEAYLKKFPTRMGLDQQDCEQDAGTPRESLLDRGLSKVQELGLMRVAVYSSGWLLRRAGERIQSWSAST